VRRVFSRCGRRWDKEVGDLFKVFFFAVSEIEHFFCIFDEDCAFCFCLGGVEGTGEDGYFGV